MINILKLILIITNLIFISYANIAIAQSQQNSSGKCSPNIYGNNNSVNCPLGEVDIRRLVFERSLITIKHLIENNRCSNKKSVSHFEEVPTFSKSGINNTLIESENKHTFYMCRALLSFASGDPRTAHQTVDRAIHFNWIAEDKSLMQSRLAQGYAALLSDHFTGLALKYFKQSLDIGLIQNDKFIIGESIFGAGLANIYMKRCNLAMFVFRDYKSFIKSNNDAPVIIFDDREILAACK